MLTSWKKNWIYYGGNYSVHDLTITIQMNVGHNYYSEIGWLTSILSSILCNLNVNSSNLKTAILTLKECIDSLYN